MVLQIFLDLIVLGALLLFIFFVLKPLFQKKPEITSSTPDVLVEESEEIAKKKLKVKEEINLTKKKIKKVEDNLNK